MSKPGRLPALPDPVEQINSFLSLYREAVSPAALARLTARVRELGLTFTDDELVILAALDTPARVQEFLNTQVWYNNDHASPDLEETAMPPRMVLQTACAQRQMDSDKRAGASVRERGEPAAGSTDRVVQVVWLSDRASDELLASIGSAKRATRPCASLLPKGG